MFTTVFEIGGIFYRTFGPVNFEFYRTWVILTRPMKIDRRKLVHFLSCYHEYTALKQIYHHLMSINSFPYYLLQIPFGISIYSFSQQISFHVLVSWNPIHRNVNIVFQTNLRKIISWFFTQEIFSYLKINLVKVSIATK